MPLLHGRSGGLMENTSAKPGRVIVLNGVPRAGKTSIAREIQQQFPGVWMNLGVDNHIQATPDALKPGVGLRPGGRVDPKIEAIVPGLYAALYDSVRAHALHGLNVVMDAKHHDSYIEPRGDMLLDCARRLEGIETLFIGVRCSLEQIWERLEQTWGLTRDTAGADQIAAIELGQTVTHEHDYDLVVDTTERSTADCTAAIRTLLEHPPSPSAFERLFAGQSSGPSNS